MFIISIFIARGKWLQQFKKIQAHHRPLWTPTTTGHRLACLRRLHVTASSVERGPALLLWSSSEWRKLYRVWSNNRAMHFSRPFSVRRHRADASELSAGDTFAVSRQGSWSGARRYCGGLRGKRLYSVVDLLAEHATLSVSEGPTKRRGQKRKYELFLPIPRHNRHSWKGEETEREGEKNPQPNKTRSFPPPPLLSRSI